MRAPRPAACFSTRTVDWVSIETGTKTVQFEPVAQLTASVIRARNAAPVGSDTLSGVPHAARRRRESSVPTVIATSPGFFEGTCSFTYASAAERIASSDCAADCANTVELATQVAMRAVRRIVVAKFIS